jgi:protocatechuate 3,4-dioxygenase beta subunit
MKLLASLLVATATAAAQTPVPTGARDIPSDEGIVQGRVVDARTGRPVAHALVDLQGLDRAWSASTDAQGRYEIAAVDPGEYRMSARAPGYVPSQLGQRNASERGSTFDVSGGRLTAGIDVRLEPAGTINGTIVDERGEGLAGVEVELVADRYSPAGVIPVGFAFAQTEEQGAFKFTNVLPGDYYVRAYTSAIRPPRDRGHVYRASFFPGVSQVEFAQRVKLAAGEEAFGVTFPLLAAQTRRLAGTVSDSTGLAVEQTRVRVMGIGLNSTRREHLVDVGPGGRFEIRDVTPGPYLLNVIDPTPGRSSARWLSATREIAVEDDVVDLELRAGLGVRVEGRIVCDPDATQPLDPLAVSVEFERRIGAMGFTGVPATAVGADGSFSVDIPGGFSFVRTEVPAQWTVKALHVDGGDVTDQEIDLGDGGRRQIEIVLTNHLTRVRGSAVDKSGRPVANGSIVVFPDDPAR